MSLTPTQKIAESVARQKPLNVFSEARACDCRAVDFASVRGLSDFTYDPTTLQPVTFRGPAAVFFGPEMLAEMGYGMVPRDAAVYTGLLSRYATDRGDGDDLITVYAFTDLSVKDGHWWYVTVMPNLTELRTMDAFEEYFASVWGGGVDYPRLINEDTLVFISACGTGGGAPEEVGCEQAREAVEPTLKLQ
jgi:hypothetical protein